MVAFGMLNNYKSNRRH